MDKKATEAKEIRNTPLAESLRYAIRQGVFIVDLTNFRGWNDGCKCAECEAQRTIYEFFRLCER